MLLTQAAQRGDVSAIWLQFEQVSKTRIRIVLTGHLRRVASVTGHGTMAERGHRDGPQAQ